MNTYRMALLTRDGIPESIESLKKYQDDRIEIVNRFPGFENNGSLKGVKESNPSLVELKEIRKNLDTGNQKDLLFILDDRSSTTLSSDQMEHLIPFMSKILEESDIFYLANFMDNCQFRESLNLKVPEELKNIEFYKSLAPNGMYATVTTFEKWDKLFGLMENEKEIHPTSRLSGLVKEGKVKASTSWPRLFVPNINKLSNNIDNYYTYPCRFEKNFNKQEKESKEMSLFWFIIGFTATVAISFTVYKLFSVDILKKFGKFNRPDRA